MSGTPSQQTLEPAVAEADAPAGGGRIEAFGLVRLARPLQTLVVPALVVLLWLVLGALDLLPVGVIPKLPAVLVDWYYWVFGRPGATAFDNYSGTWLGAVLYSGWRVARGFALGVTVGVALGILIGWSQTVSRLLDPTIQLIRPIPITAWIPFAIAWFGIGDGNAIFLIALGAFFPVVLNTIHGARDINKNLVRAARMMGVSEWRLLLKVILPNALPNIFTGMRLAMGIAWTILIVAEMISIRGGVGYVLWDAYYVSRMEIVVADMITVGLLGFLSDRVIVLIERQLLAWKYAHHSEA